MDFGVKQFTFLAAYLDEFSLQRPNKELRIEDEVSTVKFFLQNCFRCFCPAKKDCFFDIFCPRFTYKF